MSSVISKKIQEALKVQFKSLGFRKKGASWAYADDELAKWFNIQCSRNSGCIYFNVGIYFQATNKVDYPKELDCHLRLRLEQLLGSEKEIRDFYELSDFESCLNVDVKITKIANLVSKKVIPFFNKHNSVSDILNSDTIKPHMYWNNGKDIASKLCG